MPTAPTIRRARPLDVVNLYRLVSEQGENDRIDPSDEARALAFVLDVIATGYVLVAENKAGRIVATLGLAAVRPKDSPLFAGGVWFIITRPYRVGPIALDLLDIALRSADQNGLAIHFARSPSIPDEVMHLTGFKPTEAEWIRKGKTRNAAGKGSIHR